MFQWMGEERVQMTLSELLAAISNVAADDEEAFDLLEFILAEGLVGIVTEPSTHCFDVR